MAMFSKIKNCLRASVYQEGLVVALFCPLRRKHHQIWKLQWTYCSKETDNVRVVVVRGKSYFKLFLLKGDLSIYCYDDLDPMLGLTLIFLINWVTAKEKWEVIKTVNYGIVKNLKDTIE
jgi:hypothetical protein